jgi:hypothetical protein
MPQSETGPGPNRKDMWPRSPQPGHGTWHTPLSELAVRVLCVVRASLEFSVFILVHPTGGITTHNEACFMAAACLPARTLRQVLSGDRFSA